jgi:cardiolipin synthase A/B
MTPFLIGGYVLSLAALPHLLSLRKRPAATLAWAWGILLFPYIGVLIYFLIGTDRLKRKRLRRRAGFNQLRAGFRTPAAADLPPMPADDAAFARLVSRLNDIPASRVASARLLPDADTFYDALKRRIGEARHHVHVQFFIWRNDETGAAMRDVLVAAAKRGIKVRVLLDEIGSVLLPAGYFQPLVDAGGEFSWFLTVCPRRHRYLFNLRNHRKLQVIDGRWAFVGGMNVGREYQGLDPKVGPWRDMQVELEGPVAANLQESFADDWYFATEKKITEPVYYPPFTDQAPWPALVVAGGPDSPAAPVQKTYVAMLNHAKSRIWLTTGYFVPNEITVTALQLAAERGVDVRLLVSEKTDHPALLRIARSYYQELLRAGVKIYEHSVALNHAKVGVIDRDWLMVGSTNLDNRSLRLNFELNVLLRVPAEAARLSEILQADFDDSAQIVAEKHAQRAKRERVLEALFRPFAPLL